MSRRHALALLALCLVLRAMSLVRPCLSDDEATYAVIGRELLDGRVLYRDVVDHKPPAISVTYAAAQAVAGPAGGMLLLHLALIGVVWWTGLLLARLVRRHTPDADPRAPVIAALLWCVFTTTFLDVDSLAANCELFMMLPVVASVVWFLRTDGRPARLVGVGALVGAAMLYKYQAGVQLPLYAGAWLVAERHRVTRAAAGLVALAVGAAVPLAAAVLLLYRAGGLDDAVFWFRFNFAYIQAGSSLAESALRIVARGFPVVSTALLLYVLGLAAGFRGLLGGPRFPRFAALWLGLSAVAVLVGGRLFGHYFHQLTAPLAVVAAPGAVRLWDRRRLWLTAGLAVPAAGYFLLTVFHDRFMDFVGEPDPDYGSVAAWIDEHSTPAESICIWGNSPVLYFEARRPLGCRFVFANYLTGLSPATASQSDPLADASANIVPAAWDMLQRDLAARRPRFIVDGSPGDVAHYGKFPPVKFPRLQAILDREYVPVTRIAGMRILARRDAMADL